MIDYEKLKIAHEIMIKANRYYCVYEFGWSDKVRFQVFNDENDIILFTAFDEDDLILRLKGLTQPEPRYKIGDEVFITWHGYIEEARVVDRTSHERYQVMLNDGGQVSRIESEIFPTRQALIEHQIEYWSKLLQKDCKHFYKYYQEGDGTYDCDDCGLVGIKDDIQSNQPQVDVDRCQENTLRFYGDKEQMARQFAEMEDSYSGSTVPVVDVDRCQHDPVSIMGVPYEVTMEHGFKYKKCIKCGEFYR